MACGCGAHLSCSGAFVPGAAGTGLWNVDFGCLVRSLVCLVQPFRGSGTVVWVEVGLSTLLGFEGSVACAAAFQRGPGWIILCWVVWLGLARILRTSQWTRASL